MRNNSSVLTQSNCCVLRQVIAVFYYLLSQWFIDCVPKRTHRLDYLIEIGEICIQCLESGHGRKGLGCDKTDLRIDVRSIQRSSQHSIPHRIELPNTPMHHPGVTGV